MPTFNGSMSAAVALMYRSDDGTPIKVTFTPRSIGLIHSGGYIVKEVFESSNMGSGLPDTEIEVKVNPSGIIYLEILLYLLYLMLQMCSHKHRLLNKTYPTFRWCAVIET